jgi:hypothetical protein
MMENFRLCTKRGFANLLAGVCFLAVMNSCQPEPELSLPPKTQEGRNTLGFKADGKVWVNYGEICNWFDCEENVVDGRLHKNADGSHTLVVAAYYNDKKKNISQQFSVMAKYVDAPGTYQVKREHDNFVSLVIDMSQNNFYQLGSSGFTLTITRLDTVNHILSGEFSGILQNYNDSTKTIPLTDGRFDTKLTYSR